MSADSALFDSFAWRRGATLQPWRVPSGWCASMRMHERSSPAPVSARPGGVLGLALSLGAAVSLGITCLPVRTLLPPMREDPGLSYIAEHEHHQCAGYLLGALHYTALGYGVSAGLPVVGGAVLATVVHMGCAVSF